jgi:hypothetical protein
MCKPLFIMTVILASFMTAPAHAGWGENVRLTYRGDEISPQVIARNGHNTQKVLMN